MPSKESLPAIDSNYLRAILDKPIRATQLIGHIRNATKGIVSIQNCHPFIGNDEMGTEWVIAHNYFFDDDGYLKRFGIEAPVA